MTSRVPNIEKFSARGPAGDIQAIEEFGETEDAIAKWMRTKWPGSRFFSADFSLAPQWCCCRVECSSQRVS
jgi:hypothetical protein